MTLNKGLKYAPKKPLNKFQMFLDVQKYIRKLSIKHYFLSNPIEKNYSRIGEQPSKGTGLKNASLFNPPGKLAPSLSVFKDLVLHDLLQVNFKKGHSESVKEGVAFLCQRKELIIRPADKGGV